MGVNQNTPILNLALMNKRAFGVKFCLFSCIFFNMIGLYARTGEIESKIRIKNISSDPIQFHYFDEYYDLNQFFVQPGDSIEIERDAELLLTQSIARQNLYILFPGEILVVYKDKNGNARFHLSTDSTSTDSTRNNELEFFVWMNAQLSLSFTKKLQYQNKYLNSEYKKLDSIYYESYKEKSCLLEKYITSYHVSELFIKTVKKYFLSVLYSGKLFISLESKAKLDKGFIHDAIGLESDLKKITDDESSPLLYDGFILQFLRLKYKETILKNDYIDSIYYTALKFTNSDKIKFTLFKIVKEEISKYPTINKMYIKDFYDRYPGSLHIEYLNEMRANVLIAKKNKNSSMLIDGTNKLVDFDLLVKNTKGKIIYIDFWASWCIPCREEMVASKQLREIYANKPITFFYISIDDNIKKWRYAFQKEGLQGFQDNYLILDFQSSILKKIYKINTIPRYIILNNEGKLLISNASRPSEVSTKKLIDQLLTK